MTEKETPKEPEYESKKLSETHALTVQNMKLRAELNNAKMQDLQKDLESLKGALGAYVNSIKGEYFPGTDSVMLNVEEGLLLKKIESKAEQEQEVAETSELAASK